MNKRMEIKKDVNCTLLLQIKPENSGFFVDTNYGVSHNQPGSFDYEIMKSYLPHIVRN